MGGLFSWLLGGRGNSHKNMSLREWEEAFDAADRVDLTDGSYTLGNKLFDANGVEIEKPASEVFNFSNDIPDRRLFKLEDYFEVEEFQSQVKAIAKLCLWAGQQDRDPIKINVRLNRDRKNKSAIQVLISGDGLKEIFVGFLPQQIAAKYTSDLPTVEITRLFEDKELSGNTLKKR